MAATLEIHFLMLKYTHCKFCQNYPKKVAKIKLILAKLAFATNYEVWPKPTNAPVGQKPEFWNQNRNQNLIFIFVKNWTPDSHVCLDVEPKCETAMETEIFVKIFLK
jgi:hypothetical protein